MIKEILLDEGFGFDPEKTKKERELLRLQVAQHRKEIAEIETRLEKIENRVKGFKVKGNVRFN